MPTRPVMCIGKKLRLKPRNISQKAQRPKRSDSAWRLPTGARLLKIAVGGFALATVRAAVGRLITFAPAEAAVALLTLAPMRTPVVAEAAFAAARAVALIAVAAITAEILPVAAITAIEPLLVPAVAAVVVETLMPRRAVVVAVLIVEAARLLLWERGLRIRLRATLTKLRLLHAELVTFAFLAELVAVCAFRPGKRMSARRAVAHRVAALLRHLFAIAEDDAVVVFCVLQIVFCKHRIA